MKAKFVVIRFYRRSRENFLTDFFLRVLLLKDDELVMSEMQKKREVTDSVLERPCLEEHLNLSKSGFVSEEGDSGCKSQTIAIRALKGNVLCQICLSGPIKRI